MNINFIENNFLSNFVVVNIYSTTIISDKINIFIDSVILTGIRKKTLFS